MSRSPLQKHDPAKAGGCVVVRFVEVKSLLLFRRAANYGEDRAIPGAISAHYSEPPSGSGAWCFVENHTKNNVVGDLECSVPWSPVLALALAPPGASWRWPLEMISFQLKNI